MSVYDTSLNSLDGNPGVLADQSGKVTLVVNVASFCGLTPQYTGLQGLYERYGDQGFSIVGVPCNQFGEQEPGNAQEIREFCTTNYSVTFPIAEKVEVNGETRHALYEQLVVTADSEGHSGDIRWNFEKFLIGRDGEILARYSPLIEPENDELVAAIEKALAN
jgi:glutathione peroxidase